MNATPDRLDAAVDTAADLFRRNGYDRVSIADVVAATGLNRYAIYRAFGGKKELLLAALSRYHNGMMAELNAQLAQPRVSVMAALQQYFRAPLAGMVRGGDAPGSLLCQAALEVGPIEPAVQDFVVRCIAEKRAALEAALARAAADRELRADITPAAGADLLITTMFGLGAQAYAGFDIDRLTTSLAAVFNSLRADADNDPAGAPATEALDTQN